MSVLILPQYVVRSRPVNISHATHYNKFGQFGGALFKICYVFHENTQGKRCKLHSESYSKPICTDPNIEMDGWR